MSDKSVEDWHIEIDNGLNFRAQFGKESAWVGLEDDYLNDPKGNTAIGSNLIFSHGDTLISSLNVPDPEIVVAATHPLGIDRAPTVEAVDNWLVSKLKMKRAVDSATLHAYLYGRAVLKLGYDSEYGWSPFYDIGPDNNLMGMTLTQFNKKGNRIEFKNTTPGMPWIEAVDPHDIVVPWGTKYMDEAPWVAHRIIRLTEHIKADPKYKNKKRLQPNISMEDYIMSYMSVGNKKKLARRYAKKSFATGAENRKAIYNELWEIHDRETGKVKVISFDYDKFLRDEVDLVMQACGMPFVSKTFVEHPRTFWSTPLAYYLKQIQATQFDIAKQSEKTRRLSNLRFIAAKGFMDIGALNRLLSSDVGAVEMADTTKSLKDLLVPVPSGNMMDFAVMEENNRKNAREAIGFSRNQTGEFAASGRRTAREATFVHQGSGKRESKRQNLVVDLYLESIEKLNKIGFTFWKAPRYIMLGKGHVRFTGEELEGEYLLDVGLSTKRQVGRHERQMEAFMMATNLASMGADFKEAMEYATNASHDPGFEKLLSTMGSGGRGGQQGQGDQGGGGLPTIPGTGK